MNLKKLTLAVTFSIGILMVSNTGNAAKISPQSAINASKGANLLSDMGTTGYAAPIHKKHIIKHIPKKITCKPKPEITGAACPTQCQPPSQPCVEPCPAPCNPCQTPCEPCNPCPTGAASPIIVQPIAPCQAPCAPCNPCPAPCN